VAYSPAATLVLTASAISLGKVMLNCCVVRMMFYHETIGFNPIQKLSLRQDSLSLVFGTSHLDVAPMVGCCASPPYENIARIVRNAQRVAKNPCSRMN
jgi:hypothetical protein